MSPCYSKSTYLHHSVCGLKLALFFLGDLLNIRSADRMSYYLDYLMIRQTHVFIWLLQLPRYLQLQPPLLQFTLFVQALLIPFLLPQALTLLESPKFKGTLGKQSV